MAKPKNEKKGGEEIREINEGPHRPSIFPGGSGPYRIYYTLMLIIIQIQEQPGRGPGGSRPNQVMATSQHRHITVTPDLKLHRSPALVPPHSGNTSTREIGGTFS